MLWELATELESFPYRPATQFPATTTDVDGIQLFQRWRLSLALPLTWALQVELWFL